MSLTLLPGSIVAMTDQAADRLLRLDNGDAALLCIHLLRRGNLDSLTWTQPRLDAALSALRSVGMAPDLAPRTEIAPQNTEPPEYHMEDITAVLAQQLAEGHPVDVTIDCLGGELMGKCLHYLRHGARWIMIAALAGTKTEIDLKNIYVRNVRIIGSTLRT